MSFCFQPCCLSSQAWPRRASRQSPILGAPIPTVYRSLVPYARLSNYTPAWAIIMLGLADIRDLTGVPYYLLEKGLLTFVDVLNALLIGLIVRRSGKGNEIVAFAAYLLNPLSIYV